MKHLIIILLAAAASVLSTAQACADQLPGTLNFANVTKDRIFQTTLEVSSNEKEVEFGDFDNDNDLDVVIGNAYSDFGTRRNKLYRNDDGVFQEITSELIIPGFILSKVTRSIFLRDYTGDGWLDIYVVNDGNSNADQLLINIQEDGVFSHFVDETAQRMPFTNGCIGCTGASNNGESFDVDYDGDIDIFSANGWNDANDRLYLNDGFGVFTDATESNIPLINQSTIDVVKADMNGDGLLDLLASMYSNTENLIYYNNNNGGGSGIGDFAYKGSVQEIGPVRGGEHAMGAGDFDNDGRMDIYWGYSNFTNDRILHNLGNDRNGKAIFETINILPPSVTEKSSRKITVIDLNGDGRVDVVVAKETGSGRPTILRNTTVNGEISFVDWTPGNTFPNGNQHTGWHIAAFDSNNDGDIDLFLGGWAGDHLFENVRANEVDENELGGILPPVYNADPVAVLGHSQEGEVDLYIADDIGDASFIAVVLNGPDDYHLEIRDDQETLLGESDRGGLGIEEALQIPITSAGTYKIRVTVNQHANSPIDLDGDGSVGTSDLLLLFAQWGTAGPADFDGNGTVNTIDLLILLSNWGSIPSSNDYVLEILSRTGP